MADKVIKDEGATTPTVIARRQNITSLLLRIANKVSELSEQLGKTKDPAQRELTLLEISEQTTQHQMIRKAAEKDGLM